ncbi:hypothetical protein ACM66B_003033 [Microbotryomycetes sp. NB124-2]
MSTDAAYPPDKATSSTQSSNEPSPDEPSQPTTATTTYPPTPAPAAAQTSTVDDGLTREQREAIERDADDAVGPPALMLRLGLAARLLSATREMDDNRKKSLITLYVVNIVQIVLWSVILARQWNRPCDQPLRWFLALTCIRLGLALPAATWSALVPPPPRRRESPESIAAREAQRRFGSFAIDRRVRHLSSLLSLFALVLFFLGNIWWFSSETCAATANGLHKASLAALIIAWIYAAESILLLVAIIFFLPVVLVTMRMTGYGAARHEIGPMDKEQIDKLPLGIYVGELPESTVTPAQHQDDSGAVVAAPKEDKPTATIVQVESASPSHVTSTPTRKTKTKRWWRLWRSASASDRPTVISTDSSLAGFVPLPAGMQPLRLPPSQASCSICLCDYEVPPLATDNNTSEWEPQPLRILPCGHAFHAPCLESWLVVSGRCPLCQKPADPNAKEDSPPPPADASNAV